MKEGNLIMVQFKQLMIVLKYEERLFGEQFIQKKMLNNKTIVNESSALSKLKNLLIDFSI